MTGSYFLHGARVGKVLVHLKSTSDERKQHELSTTDLDGHILDVDANSLLQDAHDELHRAKNTPSPLHGIISFLEALIHHLSPPTEDPVVEEVPVIPSVTTRTNTPPASIIVENLNTKAQAEGSIEQNPQQETKNEEVKEPSLQDKLAEFQNQIGASKETK